MSFLQCGIYRSINSVLVANNGTVLSVVQDGVPGFCMRDDRMPDDQITYASDYNWTSSARAIAILSLMSHIDTQSTVGAGAVVASRRGRKCGHEYRQRLNERNGRVSPYSYLFLLVYLMVQLPYG
jgi:hypothetical protein